MQWALCVESEIFERRRYTIVQARRVCNEFQTKTNGFSVQLFLPQDVSPLSKSNILPLCSHHSITSSARASTDAGSSRPSVLAVFRLITSAYLVGA